MDISAALTAVSQAIGIVKSLKEIDHSFDVAVYKSQMAELYGSLADVKIALSDARQEISDRDAEINALKKEISALKSGETCPICETGRMKVTASRPHPSFSFAGVQERTVACDAQGCGHTEKRLHDPGKIIK